MENQYLTDLQKFSDKSGGKKTGKEAERLKNMLEDQRNIMKIPTDQRDDATNENGSVGSRSRNSLSKMRSSMNASMNQGSRTSLNNSVSAPATQKAAMPNVSQSIDAGGKLAPV